MYIRIKIYPEPSSRSAHHHLLMLCILACFKKKQLLVQCQKIQLCFLLAKNVEQRSEDSPLKSQNPPPEQCTGHTESQRLIV